MKFITILTIAYLVITGDLFAVMANEANEHMRTSNICLDNNPELSPFYDLLYRTIELPKEKQYTSKDPMTNKARSMGFDNYDEIARAAAALKNPEKESIYKKRLLLIDLGAVNGAVALYTLTQKLDDILIFNVSGYYYTAMMPIVIGIKEPRGSAPKRGDPLCLYGVQYRLLEVIKTKTIDGFDSVLPIFEPIKFNIVEATMDKIAEKKKADAARLEAKRMRQSKELKQRHKEEQRIAVIEKDIADYQKITSSANDKEILSTAWQSLVNKYPEAKNVEMGNVTAIMMVLRLPNSETVIDNVTGLIWQKDDNGLRYPWVDAMTYCRNLRLRELSDWRLPTITELESLVVHSKDSRTTPQIDIALFPNTKSAYLDNYWSATTIGDGKYAEAYALNFNEGRKVALYQTETFYTVLSTEYVRCVR